MKLYEYNADTGALVVYSAHSPSEYVLLKMDGIDAALADDIAHAIRSAEEVAFRAGQLQVRTMMQKALSDVGRRILEE